MAGESETLRQSSDLEPTPDLWRAPEEWAGSAEFRDMMTREFPDDADTWTNPVTRRQFIALMGASVALAGANGCSPRPAPQRKIFPYTKIPDGMTPGIPLFFSTATLLGGVATGVLVKSHEGRPVKIEGNPSHPGSLGGTDVFSQAAILNLYDPDRSKSLTNRGASRTWDETISTLRMILDKHQDKKESGGIRILTETITSPTFAYQIGKLLARYKKAKWVQYEPASRDAVREGAKRAFGSYVSTVYDFTKANVVLSLDADFLTSGPGAVRYARDFISRRKVRQDRTDGGKPEAMNRLYAVEPMLTSTGAVADHRFPLKGAEVEAFAQALAAELKVPGTPTAGAIPDSAKAWIKPLAADLLKNRGASVVVAGDHQPAAVHALAHAINAHLDNAGKTVQYIKSIEARPENQAAGFVELVKEMNDKQVDILFILGGNPVFNAPADVDFTTALNKVGLLIHLGEYQDETAAHCHWHLPAANPLETWGDARGYDGTATVMQLLIAPLYSGHSALELIAALAFQLKADDKKDGDKTEDALDYSGLSVVRAYWKNWFGTNRKAKDETDFDTFWEDSLREGVVAGTGREAADKLTLSASWAVKDTAVKGTGADEYEVNFRIDPTIYDGRFANNGWLQELPKPVSKLCWDNAAIMSPNTANKLKLSAYPRWTAGEHGRMEVEFVDLVLDGRTVRAAAWPQPGHADGSVTIYLGHGRERAGQVGDKTGFNAYQIRTNATPWIGSGLKIKKAEEQTFLACTQGHHAMEGRKPICYMNTAQYNDERAFDNAMAPPVAAAEKDLVNENVPGPKERVEKARHANDHDHEEHDHDHEGHDHDHDHSHEKEHDHGHAHDKRLTPLTMYPDTNKVGRRWAMAIDLTSCIGCNVCMIACMAENNIPVVGKKEVTRGREMYWIRVDRYHEGLPEDSVHLKTYFQPVPCQQCEKAPCEVVCPVGATVHSTDGLNDMVYNRCVGTRYCSNNCPYKVRRFNFFTYADWISESLKLGRNPEVTIRSRGVMEKCTYCVQRIRLGEIEAEREYATRPKDDFGRPRIVDGEIVTACQAACPAGAIVFGDLSDTKSKVRRWKAESTNYGLLAELNTMPRTSYLAAIRNPNPEMPKGA